MHEPPEPTEIRLSSQPPHVIVILGVLFGAMLLLLVVGHRLGRRRLAGETDQERVGIVSIETAIFGLMGLIFAFTYSGAAQRFEQRRVLTIQEANAATRKLAEGMKKTPPPIGDVLRSGLLTETHAIRLAELQSRAGAPLVGDVGRLIQQLSKGATLLLPVFVEGALFSTGDGHFAQGDGEVCVTAVEMGATCVVRFRVHRGEADRHSIRWPRFRRNDYFIDPRWAAPQRFIATMGMPVDEQGVNQGENLTLACRSALLNMMSLLRERGYTREQAYCICSVAVDLRISNVVDVPNYVVSALLPEDIFQG